MCRSHVLANLTIKASSTPCSSSTRNSSAVESPEKPSISAGGGCPGRAAEPLRQRLEQAERSLDRARIEIAALKSDLATLVSAVDDIKKRLTPPAPARSRCRAADWAGSAMVILPLTLARRSGAWRPSSAPRSRLPQSNRLVGVTRKFCPGHAVPSLRLESECAASAATMSVSARQAASAL